MSERQAPDPLDELTALVGDFRRSLSSLEEQGQHAIGAEPMPLAAPVPADTPSPAAAPGLSAASASPSSSVGAVRSALEQVSSELGACQRCKLSKSRNRIVFGVGSETASLMFVGEAPGADEDRTGEPFVGRAGQLLDKMIAAMGWSRPSVYIANVLKCRPPGNRDPQPDEVEQCEPFLAKQIAAIKPRVIVTLGKPAAHLLLRSSAPISALRGTWKEYCGTPLMPTFHPAYLLRSPDKKRQAWSDLQQVMAKLAELGVSAH